MKDISNKVSENSKLAQDVQKTYFDKKQDKKLSELPELKVGDAVLRYDKCRKRKKNGGLKPAWIGPYKIAKICKAGNYKLSSGEGKEIYYLEHTRENLSKSTKINVSHSRVIHSFLQI